MKNILKIAVVTAGVFSFAQIQARPMPQDSINHRIKKTAHRVGDATSHAAASADAAVVDKKYDGKYGPHGEAIYINKNSHYYYISKAGHRVYLKRSALHDKPM